MSPRQSPRPPAQSGGNDVGRTGTLMQMPKSHRIALLFNANKIYDREVVAGVAGYLASTRASWDLFLEEDFRLRLPGIEHWQGDGIIADFDDPAVAAALAKSRVPV